MMTRAAKSAGHGVLASPLPSKGTTKRGIRIDDALWADFQAATNAAGTNPSETIRQLIRDWLNKHKQRGTK